MTDFTDQLGELLDRRDLFHLEEFSRQVGTTMRAFDVERGWELGPDVLDATRVSFSLSIQGSLREKKRIDSKHSLPVSGRDWVIVSGLMPRDAEQYCVFDGVEYDASLWSFDLLSKGERDVVYINTQSAVPEEVVRSMLIAEIGEVNFARFIKSINVGNRGGREFGLFAASFATLHPTCEFVQFLACKRSGLAT